MENFVNIMSVHGHTQCFYDLENKAEYERQRADFMKKLSDNMMYGVKDGQQTMLLNAYDRGNFSKMDSVLVDPDITNKTIAVELGAG